MASAKSPGLTPSGLQKLITPSSVRSLSKPNGWADAAPPASADARAADARKSATLLPIFFDLPRLRTVRRRGACRGSAGPSASAISAFGERSPGFGARLAPPIIQVTAPLHNPPRAKKRRKKVATLVAALVAALRRRSPAAEDCGDATRGTILLEAR